MAQTNTVPITSGAEELLRAAFRYHDALVSYAYGLLRDWALAEDAVQETFIVVQRKAAEFRPGAEVLPWVRGMVRFEALNLLRTRAREQYPGDAALFALVDAQFERHLNHDAVVMLERQKAALRHCLEKLEPAGRQMLLGFYRDRLSGERLAELHRRSANAVRLALSRLRERLRDCTRRRMDLPEPQP